MNDLIPYNRLLEKLKSQRPFSLSLAEKYGSGAIPNSIVVVDEVFNGRQKIHLYVYLNVADYFIEFIEERYL